MSGSYLRNPLLVDGGEMTCFSCGGVLSQIPINAYKMDFSCKQCGDKISLISKEGIPIATKALGIVK